MSSNSSKFQKATFEVRSIAGFHCGVGEIACWCDLLAIEEVSRRLELTLATCGYIILQGCTIIIVARTLRTLATGLRLTIRCWSARSAVHQRIQRTDSVASKLALHPPLIRGLLGDQVW